MAIGIDITQGTDSEIFDDLLEIARCDPGLSASRPTDFQSAGGGFPFPITVFYNQRQQGVTSSNRLLELVKSPSVVMIVGVPFTFVLPGGIPITAVAGGTYPAYFLSPITVYLDVTEANGQTYYVLDKNGQPIDDPRPVILYHELAHAYHIIKGDIPADPAAAETQAQADENGFRSQLGLPLRNPTNHAGGPRATAPSGGVTFPRCKPTEQGWSPGWKCLVATAALGTPHAPQVAALRRARCQFKNLSRWTGMIAGPVLESYARFSPRVVQAMASDPSLRDAVLTFAVQPVSHLVNLVELYLETDCDTPDLLDGMRRSLLSYVKEVDEAGGIAALQVAASEIVLARQMFDSGVDPRSPCAEVLQWPRDLYRYLANVVRANVSDTTTYEWAFEGLGMVLEQTARLAHDPQLAPDFASTLGAWLARLPIPADPHLALPELREELDVLAERLFNRKYTRERFARHLLARWPASSVPDLLSLLRELDYTRADN